MASAGRASERCFPPAFLVSPALAAARLMQQLMPEVFTWLLNKLVWPIARRLEGWHFSGIIERRPVQDMDAEWLTLPGKQHDARTAVLFLQGGAFITRSPSALAFAARLLPRLEERRPPILVLNYTIPGCYDGSRKEVQAALEWLQGQGFEHIILAGDSAGGYLAVQCSAASGVLGAVGICPWLDFSLDLGSWHQNRDTCLLTRRWVKAGRQQFLRNQLKHGKNAEKLPHDFSMTAATSVAAVSKRPILLVACASDCVRDDAFAFRDRAQEMGAEVEVFECQGPNCFHNSLLLPLFHEASHRAAFDRVAEKLSEWLKTCPR